MENKPGESLGLTPVGVVRSPYREVQGMPLQPSAAAAQPASIEIFEAFAEGLKDLAGFSHIVLVCWMHKARPARLAVVPFLDTVERGIFATRAPAHPNPLGLSVVRLEAVEGRVLRIAALDLLDGTPVIDIKPYVPRFDAPSGEIRTGWLDEGARGLDAAKADGRYGPQ